jgi:hypothetical protein
MYNSEHYEHIAQSSMNIKIIFGLASDIAYYYCTGVATSVLQYSSAIMPTDIIFPIKLPAK